MLKSLRRGRVFYTSLLAFAGPLVLQNLIGASVGIVDTFMVGALGQNEIAGISLANTPFFIIMLMVFGLQSGGSVLISQYWGKQDKQTINRVLGVNWIAAGTLTLIFASVVTFFPRQIMGLTTNNQELLDIAVRYGRIVAVSYFLNSFTTIYIGARRACESPKFGTVVVSIGMCTNLVFDYALIFGKFGFPEMGLEGTAWGTVIGRSIELVITIAYIAWGDRKRVLPLIPKYLLRPGKIIVRDFIKYSAPVLLNETLWATGFSLYTVIYGHMERSADVVAAYSLAGNIDRIVTVITFALANTAAVFIGKAIGGGQSREEVYSLGKTFATLTTILGVLCGLLLVGAMFGIVQPFIFPRFQFTEYARHACIVMGLFMGLMLWARAFNATMIVGIVRGGGDVNFGLYLDIGAMYIWSLPLAALTALVFKLDILWVYILVISEEPIKFLICTMRFRSQLWIHNVTRDMATAE